MPINQLSIGERAIALADRIRKLAESHGAKYDVVYYHEITPSGDINTAEFKVMGPIMAYVVDAAAKAILKAEKDLEEYLEYFTDETQHHRNFDLHFDYRPCECDIDASEFVSTLHVNIYRLLQKFYPLYPAKVMP